MKATFLVQQKHLQTNKLQAENLTTVNIHKSAVEIASPMISIQTLSNSVTDERKLP